MPRYNESCSVTDSPRTASERLVVFLIGAVQFVNILDFVMVMPLGPDFAKALHIDASHLGYIGGAYTAAASLSGLAGSFFLDRFDRRKALGVAMLGLVCGTAAGGLATGLPGLLCARVLAGMFGGPATSLSFSIIADVIPAERRGKAMGAVMGAFSFASVVGVPIGLELARLGGWRAPFLGVAALGLLVTCGVIYFLPPMRLHLQGRSEPGGKPSMPTFGELFASPIVLLSYAMTATVMMAGFILIPNISTYVQGNLHFPREGLGTLYLAGGTVSFFATRAGGYLVDKLGSFRTAMMGTLVLLCVQYLWFVNYPAGAPMIVFFMGFMLAMGLRNVSYNTLTSKVPSPRERARFLSIQSSVQHAAAATGAFISSLLLQELPDHSLSGVPRVAAIAITLSALVPVLIYLVERAVTRRDPRGA
jgi:predicted MFS family arabinose efflux permease